MAFDRRILADGAHALFADGLSDVGAVAVFTERAGGVSAAPFHSLNLSFAVGDEPSDVRKNQEKVANALGLDRFALAEQVHGCSVAEIDAATAGAGFGHAETRIPARDALLTRAPGVAVAVLTADCVPVALAAEGVVSVVHAGWRGLAAGIVGEALAAMGPVRDVRAAVGPAIGKCHYEVGPEVVSAVRDRVPGTSWERRAGSAFLDLSGTVQAALRDAGVQRVDAAEICTACHEERFFSYRRDGGRTGRQAVVAFLRGASEST